MHGCAVSERKTVDQPPRCLRPSPARLKGPAKGARLYLALRQLWTSNAATLNKRIEGFYNFLLAYPEGQVSGLMQPGHGDHFIQDYAVAAKELSQIWTLGNFAKFTPPTVANGRVYMATFSNQLVVYGLLDHDYPRPGANAKEIGPILDLLLQDDD